MKAITTTYHGPTNTRGSRIAACDEDGNRVTIPYPYELSGEDVHHKAALALCEKMGWTGRLTGASLKSGYVFVFTEAAVTRARNDHQRVNGKIFVTVKGGVADVCEDTVPAGYTVEIIDFDNIEAGDDYPSDEARKYACENDMA